MTASSRTLLIIDDDQIFGRTSAEHLGSGNLRVLHAATASEGLRVCAEERIDVVLLDQKLPDAEGHSLCPKILRQNPEAKIIFITAHPSFEHAVKALKAGASDYLSKPMELDELEMAVCQALKTIDLERVAEFQRYETEKARSDTELVGLDGGLLHLARQIQRASELESPVLITGETGTGKNMLARAIHYGGLYRERPFVAINCAALPESLIEAELFGYEKGAFTGAQTSRKGIFEMAEGGTLLLDEIGEIPLNLQAKLLGVLDDKILRRLGGDAFHKVDVRIMAATSVELEDAVARRAFREDLYYRIGVLRMRVPPLRERPQDIPALCRHLLKKISGGPLVELPESEVATLANYRWPGNIRELRNVLERAVVLAEGPYIFPSELLYCRTASSHVGQPPGEPLASENGVLPLTDVEKRHIAAALRHFSGNYTRTANALGISLSTVKRKVKQYGLA